MSFALDLHVDDGYMTGPAEKIMKGFLPISRENGVEASPIIGVGNSFEHVGALRVIDEEGMCERTGQVRILVLTMMRMKDCHPFEFQVRETD